MSNIVAVLFGVVGITVIAFVLVLVYSSLDDADFWLKILSGILAVLVLLVGISALITGHYQNEKLKAELREFQFGLEQQRERANNAEKNLSRVLPIE